jgi:hypothetical protein
MSENEREEIYKMIQEAGYKKLTDMRTAEIRTFDGGATRNPLGNKIQYFGPDGLISIPALRAYGRYMRTHRKKEGTDVLRAYNNWRSGAGIPQNVCIDSLGRHVLDMAELLEVGEVIDEITGEIITIEDAACAIIFNAFSILDVELKTQRMKKDLGLD